MMDNRFVRAAFYTIATVGIVMRMCGGPDLRADPAQWTATVSWTVPTTREDGAPLDPSEIGGYLIKWEFDGTEQPDIYVENVESHVIQLEPQVPRDAPYVLAATIAAVDTDGTWSDVSEPVTKAFGVYLPPPSAGVVTDLVIECNYCTIIVR